MARILTDRPSSGKSVLLFIPVASNSGFVSTAYTTLIEAPDFSVPDEGDPGSVVDPGDSSRVLAPGEVAFRSPLAVTNTTSTTRWVQLQVLLGERGRDPADQSSAGAGPGDALPADSGPAAGQVQLCRRQWRQVAGAR
jgi:hypothetical protein